MMVVRTLFEFQPRGLSDLISRLEENVGPERFRRQLSTLRTRAVYGCVTGAELLGSERCE